MPNYTYTGMDPSISLRGITFPQGEAVEVDDPAFEAKLGVLPYFSSDKPESATKPAPNSEADTPQVQELRRKVNALEAENATLRRQLLEATGEQEPEEDIFEEPEPVEVEMVDPNTPDEAIEIPEDWRDWHWKRQMVLAKNFTDMGISNQADAIAAIELELETRGNA